MTPVTAKLRVIQVKSAARKNVHKKYFCVYGYIKEDIRKMFPDGEDVHTSPVCQLDYENNLVMTVYSTYQVSAADLALIDKQVAEGGFKLYPRPKRK